MYENSEYPITNLTWFENGSLLDLTQGITFTLTIANDKQRVTATGTVQALRDQRPNVKINWATTDISALLPGLYSLELKARDQDSKDRYYRDTLLVKPVV